MVPLGVEEAEVAIHQLLPLIPMTLGVTLPTLGLTSANTRKYPQAGKRRGLREEAFVNKNAVYFCCSDLSRGLGQDKGASAIAPTFKTSSFLTTFWLLNSPKNVRQPGLAVPHGVAAVASSRGAHALQCATVPTTPCCLLPPAWGLSVSFVL